MLKNKLVLIIIIIAILGAVGAGLGLFVLPRNAEKAALAAGQAALDGGDFDAAVTHFHEAQAVRPESAHQLTDEVLAGRGLAHLGAQNYQAAVDDLTTALAADGGNEALLAARAEAYTALGEHDKAIADVSQLIGASVNGASVNGASVDLYLQRAALYEMTDASAETQADYNAILTLDPANSTAADAALALAVATGEEDAILAAVEDRLAIDKDSDIPTGSGQAEAFLQRGLLALANRQDTQALADLTAALEIDPENKTVTAALAQLNLAMGVGGSNGDGVMRGLDVLNEAVAVAPVADYPAVLWERGQALLAAGYPAQALSDAQLAIDAAPDWSWGYGLAADSQMALGNAPDAVVALNAALERSPASAYYFAQRATAKWAAADETGALADAAESLGLENNYAPALRVRADVAAANGDLDKALADYGTILSQPNAPAAIYLARATVHSQQESWEEALADYDEALKAALAQSAEETTLAALTGRGKALVATGDYEAAIDALSMALLMQSSDLSLLTLRAQSFLETDQLEAAALDAEAALAIDKNLAEPRLILGLQAFEQERYFQAVIEYTKALDVESALARAYAARARAQLALGDKDRAEADVARAIDQDDELVEAYLARALISTLDFEWSDAFDNAETAVDLAPDDAQVYETRGLIYLSAGDANEALDDFDEVVKLEPDSAEGYLLQSAALDELQRYDDAIDTLNAALALAEDVTDIELAESTIADLERIPAPQDGARTWTDVIHDFTVSYPDTWRQFVDPGEEQPILMAGPLDKDYRATVNVSIFNIGVRISASRLASFIGRGASTLPDYDLISETTVNVAGITGIKRVYSWTATDDRLRDIPVTVTQIYLMRGEEATIITATSRGEDLDKYQAAFDIILDSFQFNN